MAILGALVAFVITYIAASWLFAVLVPYEAMQDFRQRNPNAKPIIGAAFLIISLIGAWLSYSLIS
jgi:amino acid transporter